jgi:hypothetical protein
MRIDERTDTAALERKLERDPPPGATVMDTIPTTELGRQQELEVNRARKRALQRERAQLSPTELSERTVRLDERRNLLQLGGATEQNRPQGLEASDDDARTIGIDVLPLDSRIMRNGLMEADEAEVTFDHRTVPVDPRVLRAVFLDLVIGTVGPDDFEFGVLGVQRSDGSPLSVVQRQIGQDVVLGSSTRFVGYVDDWKVSGEGDGDTISIRARDMTAPLIDQKLPSGVSIDLTQPIADGVQELVDTFAATRGMKVVFGNPIGEDTVQNRGDRGPIPGDTVPKPLKARRGRQSRRKKSGDTSMTVWDHIVDTVVATGYLPIIRGLSLYIIEPRTFYQGTASAKKLVYGRNLSGLEYARKLGGVSKVPTIEVRCPDPEIARTRWARAPVKDGQQASGVFGINDPPKANRANNISPGGSAQEEIKVIPISGVSDGAALERIAQSLYEQIGRQEIEGNFSTDDITAFESEEEGDLLNMLPGDAVEVLIAPLNAATTEDSTNTTPGGSVSSLQELNSFTIARRKEFLVNLGYADLAAERLAEAQEQTHLVTTFRVQDVTIDWSQEEGVSIEGDFVNFIVAREAPQSAQQSASADVLGATAGSTSLASQATEAASAAGNTAGTRRQRGEISNEEYERTSTEERARQQRANQARRRGG